MEGDAGVLISGDAEVFRLAAFGLALPLPAFFSLVMAGHIVLSVLAVQVWYKPPRLLTSMALGVSRIAAGDTLATLTQPAVVWLGGIAAGAVGEVFRRRKVGFI